MKQELAQIYHDVSAGRLTQDQALDKIKSLTQQRRATPAAVALASPAWEPRAAPAGDAAPLSGHHLILCGLPQIAPAQLASIIGASVGASDAANYAAVALALFETIRTILQAKPAGPVLVQLVIGEHDDAQMAAGLAGLIETAALENPYIVGQLIFVGPQIGAAELAGCLRAERDNPRDQVLRYAAKGRMVRRWSLIDGAAAPGPCAFKEHGVYLITGGLGGLGVLLAKEILAQTKDARVVLCGRSPASADRMALLETLQKGGRLAYRTADVADAGQVEQLLASIIAEFGQLNGIVHSAAVLRDEFMLKKSNAQFNDVLRPKVAGSVQLDLASRAMALDFFVLFSSIASWTGNLGQADYAAANGFMDQFAGYRNALVRAGERQGRTLSIAWPHWLEGGMHIDPASMAQLEQRTGLRSMATAQGMQAFHRALALPHSVVMVMCGDLAAMRSALGAGRSVQALAAPAPAAARSADLVGKTRALLAKQFSAVLKIPLQKMETHAALENYGIDSILAMSLTNQLEATFGALAKTLFFEYQTIDELADYFVQSHAATLNTLFAGARTPAPAPAAALPPTAVRRKRNPVVFTQPPVNEGIAIVGLSGRYPESRDLDAFWRNLRDGKDCIVEVPRERWDWRKYYSEDRTKEGAHFSKWGGFMEGVDEFDPRFFNIAPREAASIDPQERLFLQFAWAAIEDAGLTRASLQVADDKGLSGQVGVYAGVMYGEYNLSGSLASIANRVSYFLNLHGPSLTLDTMCSSSLTALHLACQDLRLGRTSLALAGGVNVSIDPNKYTMLSGAQFISSEGQCQSFGEGGGGYIPGEGVGVAVLKRLSDAERDGNHIYGVIRGSALNHGGKTNGYTVPNLQAQAEVIRRALAEAGIDPRHISYIEAHGTGTKLGDPIEIAALAKAFYAGTPGETGFCLIGSAKSNIGHCESAAGIAGVSKVLLQMKHDSIVPSLHSATLNPHIDFKSTPFVVNQSLRSWERPVIDGRSLPRIAGISSFGAGGSNAHVIIEQYDAALARADSALAALVPLSAKSGEQLAERARDLLEMLGRDGRSVDLASLARTLQSGREAMEERLALVAVSVEALQEKLRAFLEDREAGVHRGQVKLHKDALAAMMAAPDFGAGVERLIVSRALDELGALWVKGLDLDWSRMGAESARLMSLPTYPFARERYWKATFAAKPANVDKLLHPLLHTNRSNLHEVAFSSSFKGGESFLERGAIAPLLMLEMVRAAVEQASPQRQEAGMLELCATVWGEPLAVADGRHIGTVLFARGANEIDVEIYSAAGVHCQSHACWSQLPAPARIDIGSLKSRLRSQPDDLNERYLGDGQVLALLRADQESAGFALPPSLLDYLAQLIGQAGGAQLSPMSVDRVALIFSVPETAYAWVRSTSPAAFDIDLCDVHGNVCLQMSGLRGDVLAAAAPTAPIKPVASDTDFGIIVEKPTNIRLLPSSAVPVLPAAAKGTVALSELVAPAGMPVIDMGDGVFSLDMDASPREEGFVPLAQALRRIRNDSTLKVLLLAGCNWSGNRTACNAALGARVFSLLAGFPVPVIAVVPDGATGAGFLLASVCDFMVLAEDGQYGFTDRAAEIFPSAAEQLLLCERFGSATADDLLYRSIQCSGRQLRAKGVACRIVPCAQVRAVAASLAAHLSGKSRLALGLLKTHLGRRLAPLADALGHVAAPQPMRPAQDSILILTIGAGREGYDLSAMLADLKAGFDRVERDAAYTCVILASALDGFLPALTADFDSADLVQLQHLVRACPVPVIAVLDLGADGAAWLLGLFCDALVYNAGARYSVSPIWSSRLLARDVTAVCEQRFGALFGQEICLGAGSYSGAELGARVGSLAVTDDAMAQARNMAAFWSGWPRATVMAWKQAQNGLLQRGADALPHANAVDDGAAEQSHGAPVAIKLTSSVVAATAHPDGVVVVEMQDRDAKNMFSKALVDGLKEAFAHIARGNSYKAVVLTGYDSYFATGGTVETLLAIQQGQAQFTDEKVFQLPMDCALPVVAAIQGHGIGGGWSFGMFADLVILSEESRYLSPYMGYGFTPGAGSTLMFPAKIGHDLAHETLLTAQEISGHELKARGVALAVLPRRDVVQAAIALAAHMARQPRQRLIELKQLWTHTLRQVREDSYLREVAMHEQTFVRNAATLATIQEKFTARAETSPFAAKVSAQPASSVIAVMRKMLAEELFLKPEEIDEDTQFIDLGLDSITGVTWIRKINAHYGVEIEATKVYSLPTLRQLSTLIAVTPAPVARASLDSIIATIRTMLAKELLLRTEEIDESTPFIDMGLDSITGVTWVRKINEHFGIEIEATKVYSLPTLRAFGALVQAQARINDAPSLLAPATAPAPAPAPAPVILAAIVPSARRKLVSWRGQVRSAPKAAPQASSAPRPIAVIGMAGQFPKANNLDDYWANLAAGRNCISEVSDGRWRPADYFQPGAPAPGKTNSKWLGALDRYDQFDPLFFNISPTEAECMEPQQRLFLQACWHGIEDAAYDPLALSGSQCGVFVGCGPSDYHQAAREQQLSAQGFTGAASSILAARISYFLNLRGPSIALETACSSSLVAIASACDSLNAGNSDMALAGGVYVMAGPSMHIMTAQAGMLSADGRCYSFDQRANGFVPGEGVGVLVLKRLADAERDGDRIQAVIEGWGVNQDGKTNGITAPNEDSQTSLIESVYRKFSIEPASIGLIEAHGTGTPLGDPIEVAGLKGAFKPFTDKPNFCALGSVKSNIGHCLTAAGAAGIIKLILALKHRALPPTINFEQRNEHFRLDGSPFYINDTLKQWNVADGVPRRAAISSFGFSGTNAHIVVAEHASAWQVNAPVAALSQDGKFAIPLSARTEVQLRMAAQELAAFIRSRKTPPDLVELSHTLQVGRAPMGERLALLAGSLEELCAQLDAFGAGQGGIDGAYQGQVKRHREAMKFIVQDEDIRSTIVDKLLGQRQLSKLLDLWSKGLDLDWRVLYGAARPRRIGLPGYPFAADRFWIGAPAQRHLSGEILHPLLHKNVSVLSQQRYRSRFNGSESFAIGEIDGVKALSAAALLEMARAAINHATGEPATVIELFNWERPLLVADPVDVLIDLSANDDYSISFEIYVDGARGMRGASGVARLAEPPPMARVDLVSLRGQCANGRGQWLTHLAVADGDTDIRHALLIDGALRAAMSLSGGGQVVSVASLTVTSPSDSEMYAWVRHSDSASRELDIDLLDAQGECRVAIRGLLLAASAVAQIVMMTPQWDVVARAGTEAQARPGQQVLVIGACGEQKSVLERHYRESTLVFGDIGDLAAGAGFDKLVWIACADPVDTLTEESIIDDQQRGILQVLRIIRSLVSLGYEQRALAWDLVTINTLQARKSDMVNPTHAALQGFTGSMAEVYPNWKIRLLDLQALSDNALAAIEQLASSGSDICHALRGGEWLRQKLVRVPQLADGAMAYRDKGVYVAIGGAGGLGKIWSRHVIERCQAQLVWIGRRPLNDDIRRKIADLSLLGPAPEYIQADASLPGELEAAYRRIKAVHPAIHGVVHCAVGAFDQSLKTVSEDDFRAILSVKIDLSVRIAQVFRQEALDFALFFSSNASFVRGAGMSGYSAGCTFKDAFALELARHWDCAVKVINWGYWSVGAGDAMTDTVKAYFAEMGYRPLEAGEAMQALDRFIASGFEQISIGKMLAPAAHALCGSADSMASYPGLPGAAPTRLSDLENMGLMAKFDDIRDKAGKVMEPLLTRLLGAILQATPAVAAGYERWLAESRNIVALDDATAPQSLDQAWAAWDRAMPAWLHDSGKMALCQLVDKCMRALPDVLAGKRKVTDVIFPNSSLELVESVYKTDAVSLAYNGSVSATLIAIVKAQLNAHPEANIRLLEIGAGTGATTVGILDQLAPYQERVAEYCYTDLSKAFLFHAQATFGPRAPFLRTRLLNIEQPLAGQDIDAGAYDIVIAANVLHATSNIRNCLRNAKALMRKDGMLLLNEISDKSLCGHLTFGLLDGWWLNEDQDIRIPGSPGLYSDAWKQALEEEGYHSVQFPCRDVHGVGQQIIMAFSDGVVRQAPARAPALPVILPAIEPARHVASGSLKEQTIDFCRELVGKALKMDARDIDATEPLERYGIDSIMVGLVNQQLQKHFDNISSTLLYENQTVEALAGHLLLTQAGKLEALFGADLAPAATPDIDGLLRQKTIEFCKQLIGKALKLDGQQIDADATLEQYGIDSVIVSLVNQQLNKHFGDIGSTLLFQFQTVAALAAHLVQTQRATLLRLFALAQAAPSRQEPATRLAVRGRQRATAQVASSRSPIAIIGISGMYPGAANLEQFWQNLKDGKNSITEIPSNRWKMTGFFEPDEQKAVDQGKSYSKWGGFLDWFAEFDTLFFGIPPREALNMDPQERLFMQAAWGAMEDAGYTRGAFKRQFDGKVGVFAGITRAGYNLHRNTVQADDKFRPRTSFSSVANRLSYFLDINGPSLPVDTMCSSSLTAIHEACSHIHSGDCALAFAGGVNLYLHSTSFVDMASQHMLSKDGLCKSFGKDGNGFVPGEGVGVVLLKSLEHALRDKDLIHGVILATHVNHGGRTNGFTVPNPVAQGDLVRAAIEKAGISARDISYMEAHGTGTELGDPIEVAGLQQAFSVDTQDRGFCKIGSAKSNIGHLEAAAGIAGVTKVLLQFKHQQIAPSLHAAVVNPHIRFEQTPFTVNQALAHWEQPHVEGKRKPRIAGVSSFGAGGANAHVLLKEYVAPVEKAGARPGPVLVPLSARTLEQLQQKASDLLDVLRAGADLASVAYTLQLGREAMEMRAGFVVDSIEQLIRNLSAYVYGEDRIDGVFKGQAPARKAALNHAEVGSLVERKAWSELAVLWVKGVDVDWDLLYGETRPNRIALPTYPFAREEYWIDIAAAGQREAGAAPASGSQIEDIINQLDDASMEADEAVRRLKKLV